MKDFNILNSQHRIDGLLMPANCVYGRINLKYTAKIDTGKVRQIFDKNGHIIFNNDGTPMIRKIFRHETRTQNITYSVWDLKPAHMGKDYVFKAWIKTPGGHWRETLLCRNAWMKELNNYISKKLSEYCSINKTTLEKMWIACNASPHLHRERQCAQMAAGRREVQTADDMLFRGHPCYALNSSIMTDDGRPKASMNKSVIATHKGAFSTKQVYDPAKASAEEVRIPDFGYMADGIRVVFPKKNMARDTAVTIGNGHYMCGNGNVLSKTANMGKDLHTVSAAEYFG